MYIRWTPKSNSKRHVVDFRTGIHKLRNLQRDNALNLLEDKVYRFRNYITPNVPWISKAGKLKQKQIEAIGIIFTEK